VSKLDDLNRTIAAASAEEETRTRHDVILRVTYLARIGEDRRPGLLVPVETLTEAQDVDRPHGIAAVAAESRQDEVGPRQSVNEAVGAKLAEAGSKGAPVS
jgi:hypothetical protein